MFEPKVTYTIYGVDGSAKAEAVAEEASVRHVELMKEDYIKLYFTLYKEVYLGMGDYIDTDWGRFEITKPQKPSYDADIQAYKYEIQFNASYFKWTNKLYKFEPLNNRNEATWSLTDTLANHLEVLKRNLAAYGWEYDMVINADVTAKDEAIFIQFDNIFIFDAVTKIAEAFNTEWTVNGNKIIFGRVESGESFDLKMSENVEKVTVSDNNRSYVSRLYAFGSTRNIPSNYRKDDKQILLNGVVQKRLMLPVKTPYVDVEGVKTTEDVVEGIVTFDDVYPKMDCQIGELKVITKEVQASTTVEATAASSTASTTTTGTTGTTTNDTAASSTTDTKKVPIYRFKDKALKFSKDYILSGQQLQMQFTSGALKGMFFDLAFNPDGADESSDEGQWFEIVINNTYGLDLPNDTLKPSADDKYVLFGWDATKMDKLGLIDTAEQALLARTQAYAKKLQIDPSTYTCTMLSDWMYGISDDGTQDSTFSKVGSFPIGQRVKIVDKSFFKSGSRESRVIGYEYKLDKPYDHAQIMVGEDTSYSYRRDLEASVNEKFDSINYRGGSYVGGGSTGGGSSLFVLRTNDNINTPTDDNVLSALRTERDFVHSNEDDNISALHTYIPKSGSRRGVQSKHYRNSHNEDNIFGQGFELVMRPNNNGGTVSRLEVDELLVRMKAYFAELEIRKISYVGGNYVFSSAGGTVYYVEWLDANGKALEKTEGNKALVNTFRCYLYSDDGTTKTMNWFQPNDQVRCQNFGDITKTAKAENGVIKAEDYTTHYWWRRVNATGSGAIAAKGDGVEYAYVDFLNKAGQYGVDSDFPEDGDVMVQFGNWATPSRQGVIVIEVTGENAPAITEWNNVGASSHFTMPTEAYTRLSPRGEGNVIRGKFISISGTTSGDTGKSLDEQINDLVNQLNDVKGQVDKRFEIWFNGGEPHPNSATDNETNAPASEWKTDSEKELHAQDLYYDTDKAPASNGGRAWRWLAHAGKDAVAYYWEEVTDADTISALEKAKNLQKQVNDIADDGIISHGSEKSELNIEWSKLFSNYIKYKELTEKYGLLSDAVWTTFADDALAVCVMLNGGDSSYTLDSLSNSVIPAWLTDLTTDTKLSDSGITADTYRQRWSDYNNALASLVKLLSAKAKDLADKAQITADEAQITADSKVQTFIIDSYSHPTPPYKAGDFWIQPDKQNNVMVCISGKDSGYSYSASDWGDLSDIYGSTDVRTILAALADKVWTLVGESYLEQSTGRYIDVYIGSKPSYDVYDSDLAYYDGVLYERVSDTWSEVNAEGYERTFATVLSLLNNIKIRVYNYANPPSPKTYDLALVSITIQDPVDGQETSGNYEIMMYDSKGVWEVLRTCTLAVLKSYGDHIVSLVAGNKAETDQRIENLSGTYVTQDSFNAFSQKITFVYDENNNPIITNFQKSGLLTTADGNILYAMTQSNALNLFVGSSSGFGCATSGSCKASSYNFDGDTAEFTLYNRYPAYHSGFGGTSNYALQSPVLRVEKGRFYVFSFSNPKWEKGTASYDSGVTLSIIFNFGSYANCSQDTITVPFDKDAPIVADDAAKSLNTLYRCKSDTSRYFIIVQAGTSYECMQVSFNSAIDYYKTTTDTSDSALTYVYAAWPYSSTDDTEVGDANTVVVDDGAGQATIQKYARYTGSSTHYATFTRTTTISTKPRYACVSRVQLELAMQTDLKDIKPSTYRSSQSAIESYIKQTSDSLQLYADSIIINASHKLAINGNYLTIDTQNFKVTEDGSITANNATIHGTFITGEGDGQIAISSNNKMGFFRMSDYVTIYYVAKGSSTSGDVVTVDSSYGGMIAVKSKADVDPYLTNGLHQYFSYVSGMGVQTERVDAKRAYFGRMVWNCEYVATMTDTIKDELEKNLLTCLILINSGTLTIPMPSSPEDGCTIIAIQLGDRVNFTSSQGFQNGADTRTQATTNTKGQWTWFTYANGKWQCAFYWGKPF